MGDRASRPARDEGAPVGGEERAREQARRMYDADRATRLLGIVVDGVAPGRATARMTVGAAMVNGHGVCHGGYLFLLADSAFAFACNTHGVPVVAAGADVEFLAPAYEGDELVAEARERVLRGRSGIYDVTVRRGDQTLAEFRGRSRVLLAGAGASGPS
jgi:phenylacetic acid degradation protein PaaD